MEKLNFYFLHGFLGSPEDWSSVVEHLPKKAQWTFYFPDLLALFQETGRQQSLAEFVQTFAECHLRKQENNIIIGYSMGGRLAMHLPEEYFSKIFLIAAHPGLCQGHAARRQMDQRWLQLGHATNFLDWLKEWNAQPIFRNDRVRPQRKLSEDQFQQYLQILQSWSLANQKNQTAHLSRFKDRVYWSYGKNDEKYSLLAAEMEKSLGSSQIAGFADAGHGVIFDQPEAVARWIERVLNVAH